MKPKIYDIKHTLSIKTRVSDAIEQIAHRINNCINGGLLWESLQAIVGRICKISVQEINIDDIVYPPQFKLFPPTKKKFISWLSIQMLLIGKDVDAFFNDKKLS